MDSVSQLPFVGWVVRLMLLEVAIMPIFDARDYAAQNEWIMPDYARVCDYAGIMLMGYVFEVEYCNRTNKS